MRHFLLGFAYLLAYTTPIQLGLLLWVLWAILATDYTILFHYATQGLTIVIPASLA